MSACNCPDHQAVRKRTRTLIAQGRPHRIPSERGWDVVTWAAARGWSSAALASATGMGVDLAKVLFRDLRRGHLRTLHPETCRLLVECLGAPTAGRVGMVGSTRRLRGMQRMGWSMTGLHQRFGLPRMSLSRIVRGGDGLTLSAMVASDIATAAEWTRDRVGSCAEVAAAADVQGWAPLWAWTGLDVDDPALVLTGYPDTDRPTPTAQQAARRDARRAADRARAARRRAAASEPPTGPDDGRETVERSGY